MHQHMVRAAQDCRAGLWFPASVNSPGRRTDWSCIWWIQRRACVPNYINRFKMSYIRSKFKPKPLVGAKLTKRVNREFLNMSFKYSCWNALLWCEIRPAIRKNVNILSSNLNLSQWVSSLMSNTSTAFTSCLKVCTYELESLIYISLALSIIEKSISCSSKLHFFLNTVKKTVIFWNYLTIKSLYAWVAFIWSKTETLWNIIIS